MSRAFFDAWNAIMEGIEDAPEAEPAMRQEEIDARWAFDWQCGFGSDLDAPEAEPTALQQRTHDASCDYIDLMTEPLPDTERPVACAGCGARHMPNGRIICDDCKEEFPSEQGETD